MKKILVFLMTFFLLNEMNSQPQQPDSARMDWFGKARLGIFIHWGIYSVNGIDESWSFYNEKISYPDYMKQLEGFNASAYNPEQWAELIGQSGARYAVITSKHHDGVALWETRLSDLNVVSKTPARRDLIGPFVKQLREKGLKAGIYYSLLDWSHPDYPNFTRTEKRYIDDSIRWERFVTFNMGQIREIQQNFNPDLFWFDGDWEQSAEKWHAAQIREMLLKNNPSVIINSRLQGYGDYATPEQGLPVFKPQSDYWELCMTMNDSWGYQGNDKNYKTPYEVIRIFTEVISKGGNLLLDIGPKADGTIPDEQKYILSELGKWTRKHEKAIFESKAGIPADYYEGPTTLSYDGKILYLFIPGRPNGPLMLKGIKNKINSCWVVGNGTSLTFDVKLKPWWSQVPGLVFINLPENVTDPYITVVGLLLNGEIDLINP